MKCEHIIDSAWHFLSTTLKANPTFIPLTSPPVKCLVASNLQGKCVVCLGNRGTIPSKVDSSECLVTRRHCVLKIVHAAFKWSSCTHTLGFLLFFWFCVESLQTTFKMSENKNSILDDSCAWRWTTRVAPEIFIVVFIKNELKMWFLDFPIFVILNALLWSLRQGK